MRDPEFVELRNRFLFGVLISIVFFVPVILFLYRFYANSDVFTLINDKKTFTMLVTSNDCDNCKMAEESLKKYDIDYKILNSDTAKDYGDIMNKLQIDNANKDYPIIVYIENGVMKSNLFNITDEKIIDDFLTFHKISNSQF